MRKSVFFINGFTMKIIAFVLMTLDHVGIFLLQMSSQEAIRTGEIFRLFGRFAFPLFIVMLIEGLRHTKSFAKYALRLGIVATLVMIAQIIIYHFFDNSISNAYSPLMDLLVYGTFLYLLNRKDKWSLFAILPFAIIVLSFVTMVMEEHGTNVLWFPFYLRSGYNIFGFIMAVLMYYSYPLIKKLFVENNMDVEGYENQKSFRFAMNIAYSCAVFVAVVVIYLIAKFAGSDLFGINVASYSETWALVSILIIMFYSGTRGYNAKWFQYASYLYFPLHLVIIYAVFYLINIF